MKIKWILRIQNKATLLPLLSMCLALIYTILDMCGIIPGVTQDAALKAVTLFVEILGVAGIIIDPTTQGILDSDRAMGYDEPA